MLSLPCLGGGGSHIFSFLFLFSYLYYYCYSPSCLYQFPPTTSRLLAGRHHLDPALIIGFPRRASGTQLPPPPGPSRLPLPSHPPPQTPSPPPPSLQSSHSGSRLNDGVWPNTVLSSTIFPIPPAWPVLETRGLGVIIHQSGCNLDAWLPDVGNVVICFLLRRDGGRRRRQCVCV